jgi:hypothetical protein
MTMDEKRQPEFGFQVERSDVELQSCRPVALDHAIPSKSDWARPTHSALRVDAQVVIERGENL